jgi:hypothetical protein
VRERARARSCSAREPENPPLEVGPTQTPVGSTAPLCSALRRFFRALSKIRKRPGEIFHAIGPKGVVRGQSRQPLMSWRKACPDYSTEWISRLRIARRGAQAGVAPPATGSSRRRSGGGLQNAEIAFLGDWYKLETPWPLDRPSQTHLGASARAPADCRTWGFGKGVVSSDFPVEVGHCARRALP